MKYPHLGFDPEDFDSLYNTNRTIREMEKFLLFAICVAGKTSPTTAKALDNLLSEPTKSIMSPMTFIYMQGPEYLKDHGIGCYNQRYASIKSYLMWIYIYKHSLQSSSLNELMLIKGVGNKTARFFLLYNFPFQPFAAVDVQILKVLRETHPDAPKATPSNEKVYRYWESKFIEDMGGYYDEFVDPQFYAKADFHGWEKGRKMPVTT